jgi:hypothetical protein
MALMAAPGFEHIDQASVVDKLSEKHPASVLPVLAAHPHLRTFELMRILPSRIHDVPGAAAWADQHLEGESRREFLYNLAYSQRNTPLKSLDTLSRLPEEKLHRCLHASPLLVEALIEQLPDHPVLQRYQESHFSVTEEKTIIQLAETDAPAALGEARRHQNRMTPDDQFRLANAIARQAPELAWEFLQPQFEAAIPPIYEQVKWHAFDTLATECPTAAAAWAQVSGKLPTEKVPDLLAQLAAADTLKAKEYADSLTDPALRELAPRILRAAEAWRKLANGELIP